MAQSLGIHVMYELYGCEASVLDRVDRMQDALREAVRAVQMQALEEVFHRYQPQGVSVVILVAESHIAVHTWPEYGYAAVDFFSCRTDIDPGQVREVLIRCLEPKRTEMRVIERGVEPGC